VTEQTETSSDDDGGGGCITVSGSVPVNGVTSHQIIEAVRATLHGREVRALNIAFVDDGTIRSINKRYLNKAKVTDVISFDLRDDEDDEAIDGEVVISGERACVQARDLGVSEDEELLRYVIHGVLHLMGYDDSVQEDRQRMSLAEDQVLSSLDVGHGKRIQDSGTREDI
jgi:rRNA maturation RNase YbeY